MENFYTFNNSKLNKVNKKAKVYKFDIFRYATLLIILVPLIVYISALKLGFVYFDDDILILGNLNNISDLSNIGKAFRTDAFFSNMSPYYRPLMNVSFMIDALIAGNSPAIYHFSNLIYHILVCLSLFKLLRLLKFSNLQTLISTLIFSVHPVMGHAILWIPARGDLLVTLFTILSFLFLLKYIKDEKYSFLIIHILCFTGALFSKESGIFLPPLFIVFFILLKEKFFEKKKIILFLSWFSVIIFWYYLRYITIDHRPDNQRGLISLLHNLPFLPEAIARLVFPFNLPVTPIFTIGYTIMGLIASLIIIIFIFKQKNPQNLVFIIFGSVWFIGFCFPNMFVRLSSANDSFEYLLHRIYLPSIGFIIIILGLLPERWFEIKTKQSRLIILVILISFISYDFHTQKTYKDAVSFWTSSIGYAPQRSWFHYLMGRYYFKQKDYDMYEELLLKADSIKSYSIFRYNLGMIYYTDKRDYEKAYYYFASAFNNGYSDEEARSNFILFCIESSYDLFKKNQSEKAIIRCQEALNNDPNNAIAAYNMGIYLVNQGKKHQAAAMWFKSIRNKPDLKDAYRSLCLYYLYDINNIDSAKYFEDQYTKYGGKEYLINKVTK